MNKLKVERFNKELPVMKRAHSGDAGLDIYLPEAVTLCPGMNIVNLEFGIELEPGYMAQIISRSSIAKKGIHCQAIPIDYQYRGPLHGIILNSNDKPICMLKHERIANLVVEIVDCEIDKNTERGDGAFGSSGK